MLKLISNNLKGYARICAFAAPLTMLVEVLMDLMQPALMSDIIDIGVANGDIHYVLSTGLKMLLFALVGILGGASCGILSSVAGIKMSGNMRQELFDKIQTMSYAEVDHFKTSSLITRLSNDVMQLQQMVMMLLRIIVRSPIMFIGCIVMSVLLSPKLSILFLIVLPIIIVSVVIVMKKSIPLFSVVQQKLDKVNIVMRENLLGIRVVKSFAIEDRQLERFDTVNEDLTVKSIKAQNMTLILMPAVTLVLNLSIVTVLWFGGKLYTVGGIELGKIMAFVNYIIQISNALTGAINLIVTISRAEASAIRINEVFEAQPSITEPEKPQTAENFDIEFKNVSFRYENGGENVLKNLSFTIPQGETVGIIGATGSGKSTMVSLMPRLYDVTEGQVLIGGIDIRSLSPKALSKKIGVVLQESILLSGTVESNLRFGNEGADEAELKASCEDAQALDFIEKLNGVFDATVQQRGKNFSGGQKQRLSIARTLVTSPQILILDDSTSAVDLITEARMSAALERRMEGRTTIMVAQRVCAVMGMDKIIVLDNGRITALGKHGQLLKESEIYRSIAVSQLGEEVLLSGVR